MIAVPINLPVFDDQRPWGRRFVQWMRDVLIARLRERFMSTPVQTAEYTARAWDNVLVDPSGGGFPVNLPDNPRDGDEVAFFNRTTSANAVDLIPGDAAHTVMGAATYPLSGSRFVGLARCTVDEDGSVDWAVTP